MNLTRVPHFLQRAQAIPTQAARSAQAARPAAQASPSAQAARTSSQAAPSATTVKPGFLQKPGTGAAQAAGNIGTAGVSGNGRVMSKPNSSQSVAGAAGGNSSRPQCWENACKRRLEVAAKRVNLENGATLDQVRFIFFFSLPFVSWNDIRALLQTLVRLASPHSLSVAQAGASDIRSNAWPCSTADLNTLAGCLHKGQSWGAAGPAARTINFRMRREIVKLHL